ncbi:MAG: response regulator transcription factor [Prevotella sp.]|nr:response regulator transcription factor [Prevotella sp.]
MSIRVLAVDDEPLALQQLAAYIKKVPFLELVAQCESAVEAVGVLNSEPVDALFCDINMPDLNGMDFVKSLSAPPLIVFTTAYSEYAVEGFRVNAVDYLLKPFGLQDFMRAANRLKERVETRHEPSQGGESRNDRREPADEDAIFVKTDYRVVKVSLGDILYVEGMSEYLKLHLASQPKPVITLLAMKNLEERLPRNFMRIHRSYIVNLDKITEVNKNRVFITANVALPIGDSYKEQFGSYIEAKFLGKG